MSAAAGEEHAGGALPHVLAGAALVAVAVALDPILGNPRAWGVGQTGLCGAGLLLAAAGFVLPAGLRRWSARLSVFLLAGLVTLSAAELVGRALGIDFAKEEDTFLAIPPCFRQPTQSSGEALFRRPGPQKWTGQVLNTRLKQLHVRPNPYEDEPVVTVIYDQEGFRNLEGLDDWDIAVVGDSFTELGYLAQEELFTSVLGRALGLRVKNLGISMTGPYSQLHYLQDFGMAPSLKDALMVFYEGNDHHDVVSELRFFRRLEEEGERTHRGFEKQSSLVRALARALRGEPPSPRGTDVTHGWFQGVDGEVPISIYRTPPSRATLTDEARAGLPAAIAAFAEHCRANGVRPWLAYMPVKARVLHGRVRFTDRASDGIRTWTPTDYPELIEELCAANDVRFIDLAGVLREATEEGHLVFNSIWDEHLNALGSALVGEELARRMGPVIAPAD